MLEKYRTRRFFKEKEKDRILGAIQTAEKMTSGEIRVHVESHAGGAPLKRAQEVFEQLGMNKTDLRNGVLIYLAVLDHQFAIIGDDGINKVVPANFWEDTKSEMQTLFQTGKFTDGVCLGIERAGARLAEFFPYQVGDVNELSNEISEGK